MEKIYREDLYGVPQGSVLEPLLFIKSVNELYRAVNHSTTHYFADNTNLLLTGASLKTIKKHIHRVLVLILK